MIRKLPNEEQIAKSRAISAKTERRLAGKMDSAVAFSAAPDIRDSQIAHAMCVLLLGLPCCSVRS